MKKNFKEMMKKRYSQKFQVTPISNMFGSIRTPHRVDDFLSKDHYLIITLTHSNIGLKIKTHFGSKTWRKRKEETESKKVKSANEEGSTKRREKKI